MKKLSRLLAVVLAVVMIATAFVGCHKKDEVAFTVGETKFTSAMFSCIQFFIASSARNAINTHITDSGLKAENVKYENYSFDADGKVAATGTSYEKFVRNETIKSLRQYAALDALMKSKNMTLDQDYIDTYTLDATAFWNYGCDYQTYYQYAASGTDPTNYYTPYGYYLEANGVAYETYLNYTKYNAMYSFYFESLYTEKGGEKEISKDDLTTFMNEHYILADYLTFSKNDDSGAALSEEKLSELKTVINGYAERLNNGETFETINKDNDKRIEAEKNANSSSSATGSTSSDADTTSSDFSSDTGSTSSTTTSTSTSSEETDKKYTPEEYKGLFGDEEAGYDNKMFAEYDKQEIGKAVVLEDTENSQYILFVRLDMFNEIYEDYYFESLKVNVAYLLKEDEYITDLETVSAAYKLEENTFATGRFDVEDINFDLK